MLLGQSDMLDINDNDHEQENENDTDMRFWVCLL